ncbi:Stk1 family PASTA domain-containing Ser/Thr kinase [Selenihalanaerobacter shriftii]|uniref:non-specific serine/threonine protein kinase n=1 Tax=Selenihalanaerobacter shriftii TaxID=142842 RepID=A0A1T4JL69_9FIRM|nr:Stk1 family PASTA domain-containing Ser/Thr kinase [Selenihalanaerobacter shriftii]SJZ30882.1 serine/threonine protein kinase [Selenihalanaerobacter shriftii]
MIGECLNNRYQIEKKIGEGGMALVYEAKDKLLNRQVAVKVLRGQFSNDKEFVERFKREAQAVASFSHHNIVNIFDIGKDNDTHYIVMENVQGETLKKKIEKEGKLKVSIALEITEQICEALVVAHRNQIVHCDIKPGNILLTPERRAKLTDFGIARALTSATLKQTQTVIGSANYFAPEQAKGDKVDERTDIYSLGIVLYEMVTGEVPFEGESPVSVALKHIKNKPKLPREINSDIPLKVEEIILKALNKRAEKRYNSIKKMLEEVQKVIQSTIESKERSKSEKEVDLTEKTIVMHKDEYPSIANNEEDSTELSSDEGLTKESEESSTEELVIESKEKFGNNESIQAKNNKETKSFFQRNRRLIIGALVFIFMLGSLTWGYYQVVDFLRVPVVEVPDVVGKNMNTAKQQLLEKRLELEVHGKNYNNQIPKDHIISQYPKAGKEVKEGRKINLVISKGAKLTKVPKVIGQPLREVKVALDEADLKVGEVTSVFNDQIKKGLVISQNPEPREEVKINSTIELIISKGKEAKLVNVPNLIGLNEENAKQRLRELDLIIGETKYKESLNYFEGQVMSQEPKPSTELTAGSQVNLVISSGIRNVYDSEIHQFRVRVNINPGEEDQQVKITVKDDNGRRIIYNKLHHPGDLVNRKVISVGSTVVQVYINNSLIREQRL